MILIKQAIIDNQTKDVLIDGNKIIKIAENIDENVETIIDAKGLTLLAAFVDIHTHLREPGFEGKEDIESGAKAAVNGGYASICCMPNTKPTIDNKFVIKYIIDKAKEVNFAKVYPIGSVTKELKGEELAEFGKMKEAGVVALSDDGMPVVSANTMRLALEYAKNFDLVISSHCEEMSLVDGGLVNEGAVGTELGLKGITRAAEEVMLARDIILAKTFNAKIHIAHVSTKLGVQMIRFFKSIGAKVTCETCPHYFSATDEKLRGYNTFARVNPPLRIEEDRLAIVEGLQDGTIDAIVTDHAPHKEEEKQQEFAYSPNGISGLETSYSLCYTNLVKNGKITLNKLSQLMTENPSKIFNLSYGEIKEGGLADLVLVRNSAKYKINRFEFESKGKNTPFHGDEVYGQVEYTFVNGEIKKEKGALKC